LWLPRWRIPRGRTSGFRLRRLQSVCFSLDTAMGWPHVTDPEAHILLAWANEPERRGYAGGELLYALRDRLDQAAAKGG
jgi:hypothetical protein